MNNNNQNLIITKNIVDYVNSVQDGSMERKHLFNVCKFSHEFENKISDDFFKKGGIDSIEVMCQYEFYDGYVLYFDIMNKDGGIMNKLDYRLRKLEQVSFIDSLVVELKGLEKKITSFRENICYPLNLKPGISEEILDIFLSKDLRVILDYDLMQLELSNDQIKSKKIKI